MTFLRRVVRPARWLVPLAVTLGLAADLGAGTGAAAASPVTPARTAAARAPAWPAPLVVPQPGPSARGTFLIV